MESARSRCCSSPDGCSPDETPAQTGRIQRVDDTPAAVADAAAPAGGYRAIPTLPQANFAHAGLRAYTRPERSARRDARRVIYRIALDGSFHRRRRRPGLLIAAATRRPLGGPSASIRDDGRIHNYSARPPTSVLPFQRG
jgi:hypothetical protein